MKHGGYAPQVKAAAEERRRQQAAAELLTKVWQRDAAPITDAVGEMQGMAGSMRAAVDVLGNRLEIGANNICEECGRGPLDLDSATSVAWIRVLRELRQLLADMQRLGIAEHMIQLEAAKVRLMSLALGRVFDDLGLVDDERRRVAQLFVGELRALEAAEPSEHDVVTGEES